MDKDKYMNEFIDLCNLCNDYSSKRSMRKHNPAMKKLFKMRDTIKENLNVAEYVYDNLLNNESDNVKIIAAAHCLNLNILKNKAIKILKDSAADKKLGIISLNAETTLKIYNVI